MTHDELEQRLWELEYGLLSVDEAAELREQITGNSEVAQVYDRVRTRLALVAKAARIEAPRIKLRVPFDGESDSPFASVPPPALPAITSPRIKRGANWTLAIAASLLIGLLSWSWGWGWTTWSAHSLNSREVVENTSADSKPQLLLIEVDTPVRFSKETKNPVSLSTRASDGTPQSAELNLRVENPLGNDLYFKDVTTDRHGRAVVDLPGTVVGTATKLKIARADDFERSLQVDLAAADTQYVTHLSTDKPRYRPGEVVRYRSVTLSRFGLKADRDVTVEYQITDPAGQEIAGSKLTGITEHGVGNGEFPLSADAAPGQYTVIARSLESIFPEVRRDIPVQKPTPRQYDIDVKWDGDLYAAGSQVQGRLAVRTPSGQPASDVKLNVRAFVDGRQLDLPSAEVTTDAAGNASIGIALPAQIASSEGELGIRAGEQDVIWKDIPLQADQVQVDFYPEGGDLTAGVENRVYFHCHDFDGRAVAVRGRVVDAAERVVATITTQHDGRGAFRYTPTVGASYALKIDDPPAIKSKPALPPVVEHSRLVLDAGAGVFAAGSPIRMKLRSRETLSNFSMVAYCRGVTVGQQTGVASDFVSGVCEMNLPVIDEAAGVLRVTVYDYSKRPPEPLAERLVFRHPQRKLTLQLTGLLPEYATGDAVRGQVQTTDEMGKPVSAVLGISAVDETTLQSADRPAPRLASQFLLLGDVDRAEKLEDANFYLSADSEAAVAIDLLLGTQGWRRFDRIPVSRLAGGGGGFREGLASGGGAGGLTAGFGRALGDGERAGEPIESFGLGRVVDETEDAPRRFDNRPEVMAWERAAKDTLSKQRQLESQVPRPISRSFFVATCLGLLAIVGVSALVRRHPTRKSVLAGMTFVACFSVVSFVIVSVTRSWPSQGDDMAATPQSSGSRRASETGPRSPAVSANGTSPPPPQAAAGAAGGLALPSEPQSAMLEKKKTVPPLPESDALRSRLESRATDEDKQWRKKSEAPKRFANTGVEAKNLLGGAAPGGKETESAGSRKLDRGELPSPARTRVNQQAIDSTERLTQRFIVRRYASVRAKDSRDRSGKDFAESVLWDPLVITDEQGRASFEFDLPDTATRFRITADGHADGRLGDTEQTVAAKQKN